MKTVTIRVNLPVVLLKRIDASAKKLGISRNEFIVRCIRKYLKGDK